jgi:hypothetical protein
MRFDRVGKSTRSKVLAREQRMSGNDKRGDRDKEGRIVEETKA